MRLRALGQSDDREIVRLPWTDVTPLFASSLDVHFSRCATSTLMVEGVHHLKAAVDKSEIRYGDRFLSGSAKNALDGGLCGDPNRADRHRLTRKIPDTPPQTDQSQTSLSRNCVS
jgi:hypothetical protein